MPLLTSVFSAADRPAPLTTPLRRLIAREGTLAVTDRAEHVPGLQLARELGVEDTQAVDDQRARRVGELPGEELVSRRARAQEWASIGRPPTIR